MILGAGTIVDAPTAALFIAAGASFVVSPVVDEATIRLCNRRRIACLPGAFTPSEVARAEELG
ncbi:MAG: bifunctional 4-hydroxy-2-oxoglutarate aldolase/2-dehydro-3-deoxy-phosphogluconate aldolase, partial [Candidatus Limnocylindrales bacterium]